MVDTQVYRWADGSFAREDWCDPHLGSVRLAESFLVEDGSAIAVDRHLDRFANGLNQQHLGGDTSAFVGEALSVIPRDGQWFPRLEAIDYGEGVLFRVLVRPAPQLETTTSLATATTDPRTMPFVKGPDLAALGNLRRDSGAGEAVILSNGHIAEGAWSSLVWWSNDTLHRVSPGIPRLASVTEAVLLDHAGLIGAPVIDAEATPSDLEGAEVWVLSSLHGIRVATEWRDGPSLHVEPGRAEYWRQQYRNRVEPLPR